MAITVGSSLLLVRCSYRPEWNFPGGGVHRGESAEAAARRELAEEIGLRADTLEPAAVISGIFEDRHVRAHFFQLRLDRLPVLRLDNREIIEARLVSPEDLRALPVTGAVAAYLEREPYSKRRT